MLFADTITYNMHEQSTLVRRVPLRKFTLILIRVMLWFKLIDVSKRWPRSETLMWQKPPHSSHSLAKWVVDIVNSLYKTEPFNKNLHWILWAMFKIPRWHNQMETFFHVTDHLCGNSRVTGEFPAQSHWRGALVFSFICGWINGWVNRGRTGDLRYHRDHYDVIVMFSSNYIVL